MRHIKTFFGDDAIIYQGLLLQPETYQALKLAEEKEMFRDQYEDKPFLIAELYAQETEDMTEDNKTISVAEQAKRSLYIGKYITKDGALIVKSSYGNSLRIDKNPLNVSRYDAGGISLTKSTIKELSLLQALIEADGEEEDAASHHRSLSKRVETFLEDGAKNEF